MNYFPAHFLFAVLSVIVLSACQPAMRPSATRYEFQSIDTTVSSRGIAIPVTYVHPVITGNETFPLVVMAHGHGGSRNEAGSFTSVAENLAAQGVASIRMDFPGCGDSSESFAKNNLSNMLKDIQASRDFAIGQPQVDRGRIGLFGWSMGGRLALLLSAKDDTYKVIATWAPDASNGAGNMVKFVGGRAAYDELKARAAKEGFAPFTTFWGQDQQLGLQWFTDMEESKPLDAVRDFEGPLLVLYGDLDDVVLPSVSEAAVEAASNSVEVVRHIVKNADHGLGVFSGEPALTEEAVQTTVKFLSQRL